MHIPSAIVNLFYLYAHLSDVFNISCKLQNIHVA